MLYLHSGSPDKTIAIHSPKILHNKIKSSVFTSLISSHGSLPEVLYNIEASNDKFCLYRNTRLTHRNKSINKIIYALEWQIVNDFIKSYKTQLKFHAAALEYNQNGYLFLGNSGSGKTSISIVLMQLGWKLLSDEFGIMNLDDQKLYSFLRNFIIKPYHPIDQSLKNNYINAIYTTDKKKTEIYYLPPTLFGTVTITKLPKVKKIFYLKNSNESSFKLTELKQYQALPYLLEHLYNHSIVKKNISNFISGIFKNIRHYELLLPNPFRMDHRERQKLSQLLIENN